MFLAFGEQIMHFFCNNLSLSYLYDFVAINAVLLGYS